MLVSDQIKVLQQTIDQLSKLDPTTTVQGHLPYPSVGYIGDMEGPISHIEVQPIDEDDESEGVELRLHYEVLDN
jgi:hypothetical protein